MSIRTPQGESTEVNYEAIHIYCDEESDRSLILGFRQLSKPLASVPVDNITIYPAQNSSKLSPFLKALVSADRPDFVFTYEDKPFLVLELTEHGYTGDNGLQRFTRFAVCAEEKVPFIYFTPFQRTRDDELDESADPSKLSRRHVNSNVFQGMLRLAEI